MGMIERDKTLLDGLSVERRTRILYALKHFVNAHAYTDSPEIPRGDIVMGPGDLPGARKKRVGKQGDTQRRLALKWLVVCGVLLTKRRSSILWHKGNSRPFFYSVADWGVVEEIINYLEQKGGADGTADTAETVEQAAG